MTTFEPRPMTMYRKPARVEPDRWEDVADALTDALEYWLTTVRPDGTPHPRVMWGLWQDARLLLSPPATQHTHVLNSNRVAAQVQLNERIVIVEGTALEETDSNAIDAFVADYSAKYDHELHRRPPVVVTPTKILSWTIRGEAARDGFGVGGVWLPTS